MVKRRLLAVVGLLTLAAALVVAPPEPTTAAWTVPQQAKGTFEAGTVMPPTWVGCARDGLGFKFTWTTPAGGLERSKYSWTLGRGGRIVSGPNSEAANATSLTVVADLLALGDSTVELSAVEPGGWTSSTTGTISSVLFVGTSCSV
jgi:hypothetical protein